MQLNSAEAQPIWTTILHPEPRRSTRCYYPVVNTQVANGGASDSGCESPLERSPPIQDFIADSDEAKEEEEEAAANDGGAR